MVNNNRAETVLRLFVEDVIPYHGVPSRVRGDHGTENLGVAAWMEERFGIERGSYIWGRYVISLQFSAYCMFQLSSTSRFFLLPVPNLHIERAWQLALSELE